MATATTPSATHPMPAAPVANREPRVINCYSLLDKVFPTCGLLDYTEGVYHGDPSTPFETAQHNQVCYVLDEAHCTAGTRILEIGCGNGTLLEEVRRRGAIGVGVTISPEQVRLCRERGLDARLLDYKEIADEWAGRFDAVVANGPIEHFVQARDAARGLADEVYRRMFELFHLAIDPASSVRRLINTTIHFIRPPRAADLLVSPWRHPRGSDAWHWAWLNRSFGGFYPTLGQFERCAGDYWEQVDVVDGTEDYHWTSEEWLRRIRCAGHTRKFLGMMAKAMPFALHHPRQTFDMLTCMLATESWNWQFRGPNPPTQLLRQTWRWRDGRVG